MDIKQMKNFVSRELKGLKQEHRLLSLRRFLLRQGTGGELADPTASSCHSAAGEGMVAWSLRWTVCPSGC